MNISVLHHCFRRKMVKWLPIKNLASNSEVIWPISPLGEPKFHFFQVWERLRSTKYGMRQWRMVLGWAGFPRRLYKVAAKNYGSSPHWIGRSLEIECTSVFLYRALLLVPNRVRMKISRRKGDCSGNCMSDNIQSCAFITRINAYTVRSAYIVRMSLLEVCLYGESTYRVNTPERWSVLICSELLITLVNAFKVDVRTTSYSH